VSPLWLKNILDRRFRSNAAYELVLLDRLSPQQRAGLPELDAAPPLFGVLVPHNPGLSAKAVSRDAALLFYCMAQPGSLPTFLRETFGETCNEAVARLVLDGVLEIEEQGCFISGAAAHTVLYNPDEIQGVVQGTVAALSVGALRYAQALHGLDAATLAGRLYAYNRLPLSPRWTRCFPSDDSLCDYLDSHGGGSPRSWLEAAWISQDDQQTVGEWRHFRSRGYTGARLGFKLYLSPRPDHIGHCFASFVAILSEAGAPWFKVGRTLPNMLRPDKMMAYFESFSHLEATADRLRQTLEGVPAHGVPFTADLSGDGLVSWGMDPPRGSQALGTQHTSWRVWMTQRLAVALVAARHDACEIEPWQFALRRLQLDGIDPATFAPKPDLWFS
jgi:hypothetical protein